MRMVNELVEHEALGLGRVTAQTESGITVFFFAAGAEKRFPCPACFLRGLRFAEPLAQREIEETFLAAPPPRPPLEDF